MPIPPDTQALINRLNQELDETEQEATEGLNLLRGVISLFPENVILIEYFAYFNTAIIFVETSRRQIQTTIETISPSNVLLELIQDAGEDLGSLLGQVLENKIRGRRILNLLEELR